MQVLRYLIASNTPFLQAENEEFVKMLNMMPPGTKVPCGQTLAGPLLDQLFEVEKNKIIDFVKNSYCTIAIDRWSTRSNEPVIGVSLHSGGKSYLVNTINTSGEPHTIEYLSELLKTEILASWWAAGTKLGFCPILAEIALSIVSAVPASAGLERHFSTLGLTYGKLRTQLGVEKAGKLAFLYKQLNAK